MKRRFEAVVAILVLLSMAFLEEPLFSKEGGKKRYDVIVVGGSTSGTAAAVQAARSGADVLLVERYEWLGGMLTSAGVSATDGCYNLRGGFWAEFRDSLETHYGGPEALNTGWVSNVLFEPSVGDRIFKNIAAREERLDIIYNTEVSSIRKVRNGWKVNLLSSDRRMTVSSRFLVDATELGDIAAAVGVPYNIGMDASSVTGENIAPAKANNIVQDLTYVLILKDYGHPVPIPEPDGYDPDEFACCCKNTHCITPKEKNRVWSSSEMIRYGKLPNGKFMINWPIEGNDYYCNVVDATDEERDREFQRAKDRSMRFLYFIQNELGMKNLGIADDEYPTADGFPFIPYHRESRRIEGLVRFDLNHITSPHTQREKLYRTAIAVGDYPVDQHHTRYHGWDELPNLYFHEIPSYGLPAGVMIPKGFEDLLVIEKSISVTNVVNGSTRLQPVVLQLGQAAGVLLGQAVRNGKSLSKVSVRQIQKELLDRGAYLLPLLDRPSGHKYFTLLQRIALTGIMAYEGMTVGWKNQSWFHADELASHEELCQGFNGFYGTSFQSASKKMVDVKSLSEMIASVTGGNPDAVMETVISDLDKEFGRRFDDTAELTKLECAYVIDKILDPFGSYDVDFKGNLIQRL